MSWIRSLLHAFQFLTCIPVPLRSAASAREQGRAVLFYPLVGLVIGLMLALILYGLGGLPAAFRAALTLAAWALITGVLHLDGLADTADACLGGFGDRERTLTIMKDPRSGPAAIAAVVLLLLIKYAALLAVIATDSLWPLVITIPVLARTLVVALFVSTPYVRQEGIGSVTTANMARIPAIVVITIIFVAMPILFRINGALLLVAMLTTGFFLRGWMLRRIGGTTGDTAGALIELTEAAGISALVVLAVS